MQVWYELTHNTSDKDFVDVVYHWKDKSHLAAVLHRDSLDFSINDKINDQGYCFIDFVLVTDDDFS